MKGEHFLIIGAGLGGLAAALSIQKSGNHVSVFEIGDALREFGAGVVITPNAMHALNFLGVGDALARLGHPGGPPALRHHATGQILRNPRPASEVFDRFGEHFYHMHRADLHSSLSGAVLANDPNCVHVGHGVVDVEQTVDGVTARFANGKTVSGSALIGCDGNASTVRSLVFHDEPVAYSGQTAYRAMVPMEDVPAQVLAHPDVLWPGPEKMLLHYPVSQGTLMNVIGIARQPAWQDEGWSIPTEAAEFSALFSDFHEDAGALLAAIPDGQLFKWGLRDREPLLQWTKGRITMLGDAAHPMTPFLGQGAVMAIEDGTVLGRCIGAADSFEDAFARYENVRKERANGVQLASRRRALALQGQNAEGPGSGQDAEALGLFDYNAALVRV